MFPNYTSKIKKKIETSPYLFSSFSFFILFMTLCLHYYIYNNVIQFITIYTLDNGFFSTRIKKKFQILNHKAAAAFIKIPSEFKFFFCFHVACFRIVLKLDCNLLFGSLLLIAYFSNWIVLLLMMSSLKAYVYVYILILVMTVIVHFHIN